MKKNENAENKFEKCNSLMTEFFLDISNEKSICSDYQLTRIH